MHPGAGSPRSPLCSPFLGLPVHASPAETNPASVIAIPAPGPLRAITSSLPHPPSHPFMLRSVTPLIHSL